MITASATSINRADGPRVLIVDDEPLIRRALRTALTRHGYTVFEASTGEEALRVVAQVHPDLVTLEFALPDLDAIELIRRLRARSNVPVVVVCADRVQQEETAALDAVGVDYVTQPFRVSELLTRLRVVMRRQAVPAHGTVIQTGNLAIDVAHRRVTMGRRYITLTPVEYTLLKTLALAAGTVLSHRELLRETWGPEREQDLNLLRVSVNKLRHKVEPDPARPSYILTEARVGYRLAASPAPRGQTASIDPGRRPARPPAAARGRRRRHGVASPKMV